MGKEWEIYGEEHVLEEDTMEWKIDLPNATEVLFIFLPFGTTKNDAIGNLNAQLCDGEEHFDIVLANTASNNAGKIWNKYGAHTLLDNGIVFLNLEKDGSYWDFSAFIGSQNHLSMLSPCETQLDKVTALNISGVSSNNYVGAGSKIKIWAR